MSISHKSYENTYASNRLAPIDMSLSGNPFGASPKVNEALLREACWAHLYPTDEETLIAKIALHHGIPEETILVGAGANEILEDYLKVFALRKRLIVPSATFPESAFFMSVIQGNVGEVPLHVDMSLNLNAMLNAVDDQTAFIHFCNPNNPTGIWTERSALLQLADRSSVPLLISEANADFIGETLISTPLHPNIIIVRSFSKAYGLAGLRIGYSVAAPEIIARMKGSLRSYRVSSLAIAAAQAALEDQEHLYQSITYILEEKRWLMQELASLHFKVVPSQGHTFIAKVPEKFGCANRFCIAARKHGVAVVDCSLYRGLESYVRISPQTRKINESFILILKKMEEKDEY